MAKLIKKSKCEFVAGQIVKKNELIGIPYKVWAQLTKLDLVIQQYDYLLSQPKYSPGPSLHGFERMSALKNDRPYVDAPDTPVTDRRVAEAMEFMAEVDSVNDTEKINEMIDEYGALIDWLAADKFVEGECYNPIDTPSLGNPLYLNPKNVVYFIKLIVKNPIVLGSPAIGTTGCY